MALAFGFEKIHYLFFRYGYLGNIINCWLYHSLLILQSYEHFNLESEPFERSTMKFLLFQILTLLSIVSSGRLGALEDSAAENEETRELRDAKRSPVTIEELEHSGLNFDEESRKYIQDLITKGAFERADISEVLDFEKSVGDVYDAGLKTVSAFDEGGRNLLLCPGTCNPMNAWGWATSMKITIEHTATPQFCFDFTCDCNAKFSCSPGHGCKFCCGGFCWSFIHTNIPNYCCRIDGINGMGPGGCFYNQLCGS